MKILSLSAIKAMLLGSGTVAVVCAGAIAANVNNSLNANNDEKVNLVENGVVETEAPNVLKEAENEVNESKAKLEEANIEFEKATAAKDAAQNEAEAAEEAVNNAKEAKKLAEAEVENAKTEAERKAALKKVEEATNAVTKAEATKKDADAKVQSAEKAINDANEAKKAAEQRAQKAEEDKKALEEELKKAQETNEQTQNVISENNQKTQTELKQKTTTSENKTTTTKETPKVTENQNKTTTKNSTTNGNQNKNTTVTNPSTNENRSLTDEQLKKMLEAAAKGEEIDRAEYEKAYTEKYGHAPEEEKHEVEFHFYSTLNPLTVRLYDHDNYYTTSRCGETGSGCIWFAEFACDLNECVGFPDDNTGELKDDVIYARRASIKEYTMQAPEARYGYKFKQWELISERKNTIYGQEGIAYKYVAVYEKVK